MRTMIPLPQIKIMGDEQWITERRSQLTRQTARFNRCGFDFSKGHFDQQDDCPNENTLIQANHDNNMGLLL